MIKISKYIKSLKPSIILKEKKYTLIIKNRTKL